MLLALWFGILTSINPCPLATNIAAVSFIGKRLSSTAGLLLAGLAYAFGKTLAYVSLAMLLVWGVLSIPGASMFLQKHMSKALGPLLIVVGMFLLGLLRLPLGVSFGGAGLQARAGKSGVLWACLLGVVFALSFCPASAVLFFGCLIPLCLEHRSVVILPALYGVGTALPVLAFSFLLATGARAVGGAFHRIGQFELWARRVTGVLFIAVGVHFCLRHVFQMY